MYVSVLLACAPAPLVEDPGGFDAAPAVAPAGEPQPLLEPGSGRAFAVPFHGRDTDAPPQDTGAEPDTAAPIEPLPPIEPVPLVARLTVDVDRGDYPLVVTFDASDSELGSGAIRYEWSFGDGEEASGDASRVHTYVGEGEFEASVTLFDDGTGERSAAVVSIELDEPDCPREEDPSEWGTVDGDFTDLSGIAASQREPGLYWVLEDNRDDLRVLDADGDTVSEHDLPGGFEDLEDLSAVIDPATGASLLFVADIGDNDTVRDEVEVWIVEEPDPRVDSDLEPLELELTYPDGPHDAETLLVDPLTLDVFVVTKYADGDDQSVYVKRAPHDDEGPFELEWLGEFSSLDLTATGGSVSADGARIVVRDYGDTARMWFRDGYEPFEDAFDDDPCDIGIDDSSRGEGITFTLDGTGLVTIGEGDDVPMYFIEL